MAAVTTCACCGQPLNIYIQRSILGRETETAECHTPDCPLNMITRSLEDLLAMTDAEIKTYVIANAKFKANRLAYLAQYGEASA